MDQQLTPQEKAQVAQITQELLSKQTPQGSSQAFVPKVIKDQGVISAREWSNMPTQEKAYCISLALCAEIVCGKRDAEISKAHKKSLQGFDDIDSPYQEAELDADSEGLGDLKFISIPEKLNMRFTLKNLPDELRDIWNSRQRYLSKEICGDSNSNNTLIVQNVGVFCNKDTQYQYAPNESLRLTSNVNTPMVIPEDLRALGIPNPFSKTYFINAKAVKRTFTSYADLPAESKGPAAQRMFAEIQDRLRRNLVICFSLSDAIKRLDSKFEDKQIHHHLLRSVPKTSLAVKPTKDAASQLQKDVFCFQHYINALKTKEKLNQIDPNVENKPDVTTRTGLLSEDGDTLYILCQLIVGDFKNVTTDILGNTIQLPEMVQRLAGKIIRNICHPQITNAKVEANNLNRSEYKAFVYPVVTSEITQAAIRQTNAGGQVGLRR